MKMSILYVALSIALVACSKEAANDNQAAGETSAEPAAAAPSGGAQATAGGGHAPANVEPGSHEDWCGEHAVPESQCTRCNPDLIAAFKATGDWCEEHGLPESQCKLCNPEIEIVRPPPAAAEEE